MSRISSCVSGGAGAYCLMLTYAIHNFEYLLPIFAHFFLHRNEIHKRRHDTLTES